MELKFNREQMIMVGDIHGLYGQLRFELTTRRNITDALVIVVGDIGMGFHKPNYYTTEFGKLQRAIEPRDIDIVFIRGNHDDPAYFTGKHPSIVEYKNIHCIPDYSIIINKTKKVLTVGGGLSIDRANRIENTSYWKDEGIWLNDKTLAELKEMSGINTIVTHMAPAYQWPYNKGLLGAYPDLLSEDNHMRSLLFTIREALLPNNPIKNWYFGHYHEYNNELINGIIYQCCDSNVLYPLNL